MLSIIRFRYLHRICNLKFAISVISCTLICFLDSAKMIKFAQYLDMPLNCGESFVYTSSNLFSITIYSLAIIFNLADINSNYNDFTFCRFRISNIKWMICNIISSSLVVLTLMFTILLTCVIILSPYSYAGSSWSEPVYMMSFYNPNLSSSLFGLYFYAPNILTAMDVPSAIIHSYILLFLYFNILFLVIYTGNLFLKNNISVFLAIVFHFIGYLLNYSNSYTFNLSVLSHGILLENNLSTQYDNPNRFNIMTSLILMITIISMLALLICLNSKKCEE